jgi:hypothetical protein
MAKDQRKGSRGNARYRGGSLFKVSPSHALRARPFQKALLAGVAFFVAIQLGLQLGAPSASASAARPNPWQCSVGLTTVLDDPAPGNASNKEGVSYLYVGDHHLASNYLAEATFTVPRTNQKHGFYGNSIRLGPLTENYAFVHLMLVRNKRFDFAEHVAVGWAFPYGTSVEFKDTNLVYPDDRLSHRLGIGVAGGIVSLYVDGARICSARADHFVQPNEAKYFQVRTETDGIGRFGSGTVRAITLKRDTDPAALPYESRCEFHGWGVSWLPERAGTFRVAGAFYPTEATFFDGILPDTKCRI